MSKPPQPIRVSVLVTLGLNSVLILPAFFCALNSAFLPNPSTNPFEAAGVPTLLCSVLNLIGLAGVAVITGLRKHLRGVIAGMVISVLGGWMILVVFSRIFVHFHW
jgi:hypothetical protein